MKWSGIILTLIYNVKVMKWNGIILIIGKRAKRKPPFSGGFCFIGGFSFLGGQSTLQNPLQGGLRRKLQDPM